MRSQTKKAGKVVSKVKGIDETVRLIEDIASRRTVYLKDNLWQWMPLYAVYNKTSVSQSILNDTEKFIKKYGKIPI